MARGSSLVHSPENFPPLNPLPNIPTNIEIELLRQNDMLRGAVISAMDKIRQIRAGQKVDSTAVLETLGKQLSEARATNEELFQGVVDAAPHLQDKILEWKRPALVSRKQDTIATDHEAPRDSADPMLKNSQFGSESRALRA